MGELAAPKVLKRCPKTAGSQSKIQNQNQEGKPETWGPRSSWWLPAALQGGETQATQSPPQNSNSPANRELRGPQASPPANWRERYLGRFRWCRWRRIHPLRAHPVLPVSISVSDAWVSSSSFLLYHAAYFRTGLSVPLSLPVVPSFIFIQGLGPPV